jgi:hypothetical protein
MLVSVVISPAVGSAAEAVTAPAALTSHSRTADFPPTTIRPSPVKSDGVDLADIAGRRNGLGRFAGVPQVQTVSAVVDHVDHEEAAAWLERYAVEACRVVNRHPANQCHAGQVFSELTALILRCVGAGDREP